MNFKFFWILSIYTIWDGLSLKTISRYCLFNKKGIGLLLVLHQEWLALYRSFTSEVGVKFAQSSSQWETKSDA
jgi:hypothetical protein